MMNGYDMGYGMGFGWVWTLLLITIAGVAIMALMQYLKSEG
jgi:hypothetical protein